MRSTALQFPGHSIPLISQDLLQEVSRSLNPGRIHQYALIVPRVWKLGKKYIEENLDFGFYGFRYLPSAKISLRWMTRDS